MEIILQSFLLVFAGEMGDKTQLLALVLATKFHKPWTIMAGILVATLLNHALAAYFGSLVSTLIDPQYLRWILALTFFGFAAWILIPDKDEDFKQNKKFGAFLTTVFVFFLAEMGDKTQLATIALGAKFSSSIIEVTFGTTLGMLASNALVVFYGKKILKKIPMNWVRIFTCILFILFGLAVIFSSNF